MTAQNQLLSIELLEPAKTSMNAGKEEEAFRLLSFMYAQVKSEVMNKHFSPLTGSGAHSFDISSKDEEILKKYYGEIHQSTSHAAKLMCFKKFAQTLSRITGDHVFYKDCQRTIARERKATIRKNRTAVVTKKGRESIPRTRFSSRLSEDISPDTYTTGEAAEILGVSSETIRRMCEAGKFPEAAQTDGGHWRVPKKYFKVTLQEARKADQDMKEADDLSKSQLGEYIDSIELDIDRT